MEQEAKSCPQCGWDIPSVFSSRETQVSIIECGCCDFKIQKKVPEERIIEIWNECCEKVSNLKNRIEKNLDKYSTKR